MKNKFILQEEKREAKLSHRKWIHSEHGKTITMLIVMDCMWRLWVVLFPLFPSVFLLGFKISSVLFCSFFVFVLFC